MTAHGDAGGFAVLGSWQLDGIALVVVVLVGVYLWARRP